MASKGHSENLVRGALLTGGMNAVINGLINWFQVHDKQELSLTVDSISTREHTVLGGAVILAASLAVILTGIGYFTLKAPGKPAYYPKVFLLTLKNAFFTIGILTTLSILFQRYAGSVAVTPVSASLIVALIAGVVAAAVDYTTKKELLHY